MNNKNSKLRIYNGMIQYILESTNYTLKNIADLSGSTIKNVRSIYIENTLPSNFTSEKHLVKLFQLVLEININEIEFKKNLPLPISFRQLDVNL